MWSTAIVVLLLAQEPTAAAAANNANKGKGKGVGKGKGKGKGSGVANANGPAPAPATVARAPSTAKATGAAAARPTGGGGTAMRRSDLLVKLPKAQVGWNGPNANAMLNSQRALAAAQQWSAPQRAYLEAVKRSLIGNGTTSPTKLNEFDERAVCRWDCYQRMTMLEPLAADVLQKQVPGDFVEAGVFTGGVSIFMTAMLCAHGVLGDGGPAMSQRRMYLCDSFAGMPPPETSKSVGYSEEGFKAGTLVGTLDDVQKNFQHGRGCPSAGAPGGTSSSPPAGVHFLKGWFNETLPGPIGQIALLRADSDLYASILTTLERLYPRLSVGGYVVFDDFKFTQAQEAILGFRNAHNISSVLRRSGPASQPPFKSLDKMVYWQKSVWTG